MNQLTVDEMVKIVVDGGYQRIGLDSIGMAQTTDADGPSQVGWMVAAGGFMQSMGGKTLTGMTTCWVSPVVMASTWNTDLIYEMGRVTGNECLFINAGGWYGPAMNIHRSPFSGRNFEYYSEDGVLSGKIGAAATLGATEKGVVCYLKHFFLNDSETKRDSERGIFTWATEQAIREIYVKPFEIAVKEGKAMGIMNGANRVGDWVCYSNGALHDGLLRGEWDFKGITLTDGYSPVDFADINTLLSNGVDLPLHNGGSYDATHRPEDWRWDAEENMLYDCGEYNVNNTVSRTSGSYEAPTEEQLDLASPTQWYNLRRCAQHILYANANTSGNDNGFYNKVFEVTLAPTEKAELVSFVGYETEDVKVTSGSLPAGLELSETGVLSGTATSSGTFTVEITALVDGYIGRTAKVKDEVLGERAKATLVVTVGDWFGYTGDDISKVTTSAPFEGEITLPDDAEHAALGDKWSETSGGGWGPSETTDYEVTAAKFEVADGKLPSGITLAEDGTLSGTAAETGSFTFTVKYTTTTTATVRGSEDKPVTTDDKVWFTQTFKMTVA